MIETNDALPDLRRILVINLGGIGDLLLSSGALTSLKEAYPRAEIDILAVPRAATFLGSYGIFNRVHTFESAGHFAQSLATLYFLRRRRYDLAMNMRTMVGRASAAKMRLLMLLVHPRLSAGWDTDGRGSFFDISIPESNPGKQHEQYYHEELVKKLGAKIIAGIRIPVSPSDDDAAVAILRGEGLTANGFLIGINPGGMALRRWPAENFAGLIRRLHSTLPCSIVLTGSPSEKSLCRDIAAIAEVPRIGIAAGRTTVNQLAALIRRCRIYITNDTGTMHLCTAVNTPGVYLFGPGDVDRYRPFKNPDRHTVLFHPVPCGPCERISCPTQRCLRSITVDEVFDAVVTLKRRTHDR